jgi:hypothetical protein
VTGAGPKHAAKWTAITINHINIFQAMKVQDDRVHEVSSPYMFRLVNTVDLLILFSEGS